MDLREFARRGAPIRVAELKAELEDIYRLFPELRGDAKRTVQKSKAGTKKKRRRYKMSDAAKKAVSVRMRKYWAERRRKVKGK